MTITIIIAVVCAYIIKGMCGFGNTLVFTTILSFSTSNIKISPIDLIVGYPTNVYIAWKERKSISLNLCIPIIVMILTGSMLGVLVLKQGNVGLIKLFFGLTVILIGMEMLYREKHGTKKETPKGVLNLIGIIAGMLCGLYGVGAFLVAYTGRVTKNKSEFRGNTCFVLLVENTVRFVLYFATGILNLATFQKAIWLWPLMLIGFTIGLALSKSSSERMIRKAVIIILILSGCSLIFTNIGGLLR